MARHRFFQLLNVFACTIGSISDGMLASWTSPMVPILLLPNSSIKIDAADDVFWLEALIQIGGIAATPFIWYFSNRIGRKAFILVFTCLNLTGWIVTGFASTVGMLYAGRFLCGFAGTTYVLAPMYVAEIVDEKIRGFLATWMYLMMLVGIIVMYAIGPFVSIFVSAMMAGGCLLVQLVVFAFMPESPYYLVLKRKDADARKCLQKLRSSKEVEYELNEIVVAVQRQQGQSGQFLALFRDRANRKALIILLVLNWVQQFSGFTVIFMNLKSILSIAVSDFSATMTTIDFAVVMLVAAVFGASLVDMVGRKPMLFASSVLTGISLVLLATYFLLVPHMELSEWIPVILCVVYAAVYMCGLGVIPIVSLGELFSIEVQQIGMPIVACSYCGFAPLSILLYTCLMSYGVFIPLYIFGACSLVTSIFILLYIPETKGKTLDEVQLLLKGQVTSYSLL